MLQELDGPSLEHRLRTARLGMLYKINSGLAAVKCPLLKQQPQRARRNHTSTFERTPCRADYRLISFFPRTVRDWNTLPPETVSAPLPRRLCVEGVQASENSYSTLPSLFLLFVL